MRTALTCHGREIPKGIARIGNLGGTSDVLRGTSAFSSHWSSSDGGRPGQKSGMPRMDVWRFDVPNPMGIVISIASAFVLLLGACTNPEVDDKEPPQERYVQAFSPLDSYSFDVNDQHNIFYPATLINLDTEKAHFEVPFARSNAIFIVYAGGTIFFTSLEGHMASIDEESGKVIWSVYNPGASYFRAYVTPYFLLVPVGKPEVGQSGRILLVDPAAGEVKKRITTTFVAKFFTQDESSVYCFGETAEILKLGLIDGTVKAQSFLSVQPSGVVRNERFNVLTGVGGEIYLLNPSSLTVEKTAVIPTTLTEPVLHGDTLVFLENNRYVADERWIVAFDLKEFKETLRIPISEYATTVPAVVDGIIYVATRDGKLTAFNLEKGTVLWKQDTIVPSDILCALENRILLFARFFTDRGMRKYRVSEDWQRFYTRRPDWAMETEELSQVILEIDREDGKVAKVHPLPGDATYSPFLITANHLLVHQSGEKLIGYKLELE